MIVPAPEMIRFLRLALVTGVSSTLMATGAVFKFEGQTITVPDGFVVEKIADSSLTRRPITIDFDELGRLYVAESSGSNDSVDAQLLEKPHSILRLEDSDGDGVFDKRTVFADKMMFPEGTLWHAGSLYVTAPPEIWKLTDTNDDGVADQREVWYNPGTLTGCANDLHGPYLGLDGWIYWCKGAFAEQTHRLTTGETLLSRAAHIFRRHPEGGGVEVVMTGGMDNPVELAFMPGGERVFSSTFLQHPGGGQRDGLIHAIYGGTYGKVNGVVDDHPQTGELLPPMTHLGPAAACALMRYESAAFGAEYENNLFSSSFNLAKVTRHELTKNGATYRSTDTDFLVSDSSDFHPTHIEEDADGSLIVVDTGGWYKLCCPTSQLHKPDVFGGLYRVRKQGVLVVKDPRGVEMNWKAVTPATLLRRLEDHRSAVRKRAIHALVKAGPPAISILRNALETETSKSTGISCVWALTRIDHPRARAAIVSSLDHSDETVRQAAIHSAGLWRDFEAVPSLCLLVKQGSPHNRRAAAEALGRIGAVESVRALLESAADPVDRVLEHSITYALIEINDPTSVREGLASNNSQVIRSALIALDQMPDGALKAATVVPYLRTNDDLLRETADWILSRHTDWGSDLSEYFRSRLNSGDPDEQELEQIKEKLAAMLENDSIQSLIAEGLDHPRPAIREICLKALVGSPLERLPGIWREPLEKLLASGHPQQAAAVAALCSLKLDGDSALSVRTKLDSISKTPSIARVTRLSSLKALASQELILDEVQLEFLGESLRTDNPLTIRSDAMSILSKVKLDEQQLFRLLDFLQTTGPLELRSLLAAFEKQSNARLGLRLIATLKRTEARNNLKPETVRPVLAGFPDEVQEEAEELYRMLNEGMEEQAAHIEQLLASLPEGDIRRGQVIFNSPATSCNVCHAIGYRGGEIGPDLTSIGQIRTERDLLEAVLYPSASFVRSYEPYQVTTNDGSTFLGNIREETSRGIELLMGVGTPVQIAREKIADMTVGTISLMPSGLTASLSNQELADLIAFLKATKWR